MRTLALLLLLSTPAAACDWAAVRNEGALSEAYREAYWEARGRRPNSGTTAMFDALEVLYEGLRLKSAEHRYRATELARLCPPPPLPRPRP